jgi:hypothetical protein
MPPERIELRPTRGAGRVLQCLVDFDAGVVSGRDAEFVRDNLDYAKREGRTPIDPPPTTIEISDPYRSRAEFAAIFGPFYTLPGDLAELYRAQCVEAASGNEADDEGVIY